MEPSFIRFLTVFQDDDRHRWGKSCPSARCKPHLPRTHARHAPRQATCQEMSGKRAGSMENVGGRVYNVGSVGFVSRSGVIICDISAIVLLNGVQEVAGSNPVAPTLQASL